MEAEESKKKNPIGASGKTVAANVKRLRTDRGLAFTELAAKLAQLGKPIPTLGLRHIEAEKRRVDSDDLVALAMALGVSVPTLLMPAHADEMTLVSVTGVDHPVVARSAWYWLTAQDPIVLTGDDTITKFRAFAWPVFFQRDHERQMLYETDLEIQAQGVRSLSDGDD